MPTITVYLTEEMYDWLSTKADLEDRSRAKIIRMILDDYLTANMGD